ncbi:MAG: ABC transporter ATP-binding protein [Candidatus Asgardarchaeia archaeon]
MENLEAVKTENLVKIYRLGQVEIHALRGVNLSCRRGEMVAVVGPSGSGKTTLLNLIGTLDKPTNGKVFIDGLEVTKLPEKELTKLRRTKIGFVFQFFNLIPVLTAFENVELPMLIAGVPKEEREKRAKELLELVGLLDRMNHKPDELSGGEQQRVAIARALANRPSLLLADEPTGDLDSETGIKVVNLMKDMTKRENATTIMVTHDLEIAKIADRILKMRDGKIIGEEK